jgi:hypothetical protein
MLYVIPVPVGAVTVMVPVGTVQVGRRVTLAVGAAGVAGCGLTVTDVAVEVHPAEFLAVTLYVPAATSVNTPVVLV